MKCIKCGSKMNFDDVDRYSKGNVDVYYICENPICSGSCVKVIRNFHTFKEKWVFIYKIKKEL